MLTFTRCLCVCARDVHLTCRQNTLTLVVVVRIRYVHVPFLDFHPPCKRRWNSGVLSDWKDTESETEERSDTHWVSNSRPGFWDTTSGTRSEPRWGCWGTPGIRPPRRDSARATAASGGRFYFRITLHKQTNKEEENSVTAILFLFYT